MTSQSGYQRRLEVFGRELQTLPDKPEETAESTLKALWMTAAGVPVSAEGAISAEMPELDAGQSEALDELIRQRLAGTPLGHLTGRQKFMGLEFIVGPQALLPRRETEILTRGAAEIAGDVVAKRGRALVVDTCCGCGNVALALARLRPELTVVGVDISGEAVDLAQQNARAMDLDDRVEFRIGDLLEPVDDLAGTVDILTCNPPYISSARVEAMDEEIAAHEPQLAFDGGPFGVKILGRLTKKAPSLIRPGGYLVFEVGLGQGEPMIARLGKAGTFESISPLLDGDENTRAIIAQLR